MASVKFSNKNLGSLLMSRQLNQYTFSASKKMKKFDAINKKIEL